MITNLQHRVIFLYSLPKSIVELMQRKGVDYQSVIKMIGDYDGVEVHELNKDFFSTPHKCNVLIILGEFMEHKNALLLKGDSIFPLADLVNLIGSSFEVNVIDCAWCYSGKGKTHDELKKLTNALVNTINGYTAVETRLAIYWLLLKENILLGRDTYKGFYDKVLSDLAAYQNGMNPKQLDSLSEGTNLGTMASGERPYEVERDSTFDINVIFHDESAEETIRSNISDAKNICYKIKEPILNELEEGETIVLDLHLECRYPEMTKYLKGGGEYLHTFKREAKSTISYECKVEAGFRLNSFSGILTIKIKNKPDFVDIWDFRIHVTPHIDESMNDLLLNKLPENRNGNIIGPRVNLARIPIVNNVNSIYTQPELNYFAPTINLQLLLKKDWFKEFRTSEMYNEEWTNGFISALMTTQWKNDIAKGWGGNGKREKKAQIEGYIIGLLKDAGVLKGSYKSIAERLGIQDVDVLTTRRYMHMGRKQPYKDWVLSYVSGLKEE